MKYNQFVEVFDYPAQQLNFLAKALPDKDNEIKPCFQYIFIEKSSKNKNGLSGVATDGLRLHLVDPIDNAELTGLNEGYWRVLEKTPVTNEYGHYQSRVWLARLDDSETENWTYPNYHKIMPETEPQFKSTFEGITIETYTRCSSRLFPLIRDTPEPNLFNINFIYDLGINTWEFNWHGPKKPMKFTSDNMTALIMPMHD